MAALGTSTTDHRLLACERSDWQLEPESAALPLRKQQVMEAVPVVVTVLIAAIATAPFVVDKMIIVVPFFIFSWRLPLAG